MAYLFPMLSQEAWERLGPESAPQVLRMSFLFFELTKVKKK